jgi:WASH complex subunit strumpellin
MGRLVREILRVTDPRVTFFAEQRNTWYDIRSKQPIIDILLFRKLHRAVGSFGLTGLDRLLSFMIVKELQTLTDTIQNIFLQKESSDMLDSFMRQLTPIDSIVGKSYSNDRSFDMLRFVDQ